VIDYLRVPVDHLRGPPPVPLAKNRLSFFETLSAQALYINIILFCFNLLIPGKAARISLAYFFFL
jgi:hypothetical protein